MLLSLTQSQNLTQSRTPSSQATLIKCKGVFGPLWVTAKFFIVALVILFAFRLGLVIWQIDRNRFPFGIEVLSPLKKYQGNNDL